MRQGLCATATIDAAPPVNMRNRQLVVYLYGHMLVQVNRIGRKKPGGKEQYVRVTLLDIDDLGSIIPIKELELSLPPDDESIAETLKRSHYAAVFTRSDKDDTIILANGITENELNKEKEKTIDRVNRAKR